ncbi:MAG: HypC/HybG/HupF family hydrogenase formation chaperone [Patescibacteria group bacterium]
MLKFCSPKNFGMCLTIPFKVISVKDDQAIVIFNKNKQRVNSGLIKIKKGDYVLVQNNTIIKKINKKMAQKCFDLLKKEDL